MAKGDDAIRKKKNKLLRKKMRSDSSNAKLTARLASITASRNRRKAGKRRISEGMCFSLPTLEDPFNDRSENKILHAKKKAKKEFSGKQRDGEKDTFVKKNHNKSDLLTPVSSEEHTDKIELQETGLQMLGKDGIRRFYKKSIVPSKFLSMCLDSIKEALAFEGNFIGEPGRSLTFNSWGVEFWKCCQIGLDIVETGGACASTEQIALVISTAADIISKSEKDGLSIGNPFLLILVPTQPKAMEIRSVCKPLKDHGIHTVSVHTGALIDHQIQGLKRCEPEFLVSTPDRLSELISANAIDLSGVSLLVIDGSEAFVKDGLLDRIRLIRQTLCGDVMTVIFPGSFGSDSTSAVQNMLEGPVCRLSLSNSIPSQSACISQCVHVSSSEEMIRKGMQILNKKCGKQLHDKPRKMLFVAGTISKSQTLATSLSADRYVVSKDAFCDTISEDNSNERVLVVVTDTEDAGQRADMGEFDVIMIFDFPSSIDSYVKILTRMARRTVYGVLHSFFSEENAQLAGSLIEVLEQCGQTVPEKLRKYRSKLEA